MSLTLETKIKAVARKAVENKWSYPQLFDALKAEGVTHYETNVSAYKIEYFSAGETFLETGPQNFNAPVGPSFNRENVIKAIRRAQKREIDYPTFLKEIAAAGVPHYRVDMSARTVSYLGQKAGEQYVETVPGEIAEGKS